MRVTLCIFVALLACAAAADCDEKKVVCYWGSWSVYRPGGGLFNTTHVNTSLCTHLIYAFAGLNDDNTIKVLDPFADLSQDGGKNGYILFNELREENPHLRTLLAIGGWNEGSVKYSKMVSTAANRQTFIESVVDLLKQYDFNGLDLDWEYPNQRNGVVADKQNFVELLKELKARFQEEGLILSAAVAAAESSASQSYLIPEISKYLDMINLMAYDFHVGSENKTGQNAPLLPGSWEKGSEKNLNVKAAVDYWLAQGAPKEKLILGMPMYGHSFTLTDINQRAIGAPARAPGLAGPYTQEAGTLSYAEICEYQQKESWDVQFNEEQKVPYAIRNNQWVGYDNSRSIKEKALLVQSLGLGGAMIWSLESDDFRGTCGQKYALLQTINDVLRKCE